MPFIYVTLFWGYKISISILQNRTKLFLNNQNKKIYIALLFFIFFFHFQVFIRRIVQLRAELEDGRDLVLALCKHYLPSRQWRLMAEDLQGDSKDRDDSDEDEDDNDGFGRRGVLNGFDVDPSVRFFGIDWESVFGRCFSLSLNANIFGDQILDAAITFSTATQEQKMRRREDFDLVLINRILRDLAALEADVTSHAEAVLQGRLSKSQRRLIQREQLKYSSTPVSSTQQRLSTKPSTKVSKSRSFRDANKNTTSSAKSRQAIKYKKNKTTNLDKLSTGFMSTNEHNIDRMYRVNKSSSRNSLEDESFSSGDEQKRLLEATMLVTATNGGCVTTVAIPATTATSSGSELSSQQQQQQPRKKKTSFIQNVSSMLKNIRWQLLVNVKYKQIKC